MTRGTRNNNPLNIRRSADRWEGTRSEQTDPNFVQFETMAYGYRAAWKTLESYWNHFHRMRQPFNVTTIIHRWAPPTENDTQNYIRTVLRLTGLGGKENLPQPSRGVDTAKLERLLTAMTTMECGTPFAQVDTQAIREGFDLAFPGKRSLARTQPPSEELTPEDIQDLLMWDEYRDWG
jgi:hypothetical protein